MAAYLQGRERLGEDDIEVTFGYEFHEERGLDPPRPLNAWERDAFRRLLSEPCEDRDIVKAQLDVVLVVAECGHCPTIWLAVDQLSAPPLPWEYGILPVELDGVDLDGMGMTMLVHVGAGYLVELEGYRQDGFSFITLPDVDRLQLIHDRQGLA